MAEKIETVAQAIKIIKELQIIVKNYRFENAKLEAEIAHLKK